VWVFEGALTMSDRGLRALLFAGVSAIAFVVCLERSTGQTSEIDTYEMAVRSQSKTEALNFIRTFRSSHLVGDLVESLSPELAQQVCADLNGGGPARARKACEALPKAVAAQPVVPPGEVAPVYPLPSGKEREALLQQLLDEEESQQAQ
jgi:hypothetical protein